MGHVRYFISALNENKTRPNWSVLNLCCVRTKQLHVRIKQASFSNELWCNQENLRKQSIYNMEGSIRIILINNKYLNNLDDLFYKSNASTNVE